MNKSRLEAFSDGVMAIIITIMVLELRVPDGVDWPALKSLLPVFTSYLMSFLFVGIYWGNHHHLMHTVKRTTSAMMLANLNLLFWLSLIPFATAWMGEHEFAEFPVSVYATLLLLCGFAYDILRRTIERVHDNQSHFNNALKHQRMKGYFSLIFYAASIPLAYINTLISGIIFFVVAIVWLVPDKNIEREFRNE